MNDFLKKTSPSWNEVLTEQGRQLPCSGNSRKEILIEYLKKKYQGKRYASIYEWLDIAGLYKREIAIDYGVGSKMYKGYERKIKYGYPKECPIINKITNLIIF